MDGVARLVSAVNQMSEHDIRTACSHILFAFESRPPVTDEAVRLMPCHGLVAEEIAAAELHPEWRDPDMHVLHLTLAVASAT